MTGGLQGLIQRANRSSEPLASGPARVIRPHILSSLLVLTFVPATHAAAERHSVADLIRLAGFGDGPVSALGPGLDVAAGTLGAKALGERGCDESGLVYRELVHARVNLSIASEGARRLDLILRAVNQAREISVSLDGEQLGTGMLNGSWQRLSFRIQPLSPGPHQLTFTMTPTGESLEDPLGEGVLALLNSIRLSSAILPPEGSITERFKGSDVLWLEAGEVLRIPLPPIPEHALHTSGLRVIGPHKDLAAQVSFETPEGALNTKLLIPAALTLPWNLALASAGDRSAKYLRITAKGTSTGAIGLVQPKLTLPRSEDPATMSPSERLVLVVIPGLRSDDAAEALRRLKGFGSTELWSTSASNASSLASLLTGRYPDAHGVVARGDTLPPGLQTLASAIKASGRHTLLRSGHLAQSRDKALWAGYDDVHFADSGAFKHTAEGVLGALASAMASSKGGPIFATAILGDVLPPYLPRQDAWRAHWDAKGKPPWNPREGRKELQAQRASKRAPSEQDLAFWRALRRGKIDEVFSALSAFSAALQAPEKTRVVIVGLGGPAGALATQRPDLDALSVPLMLNEPESTSWSARATDLSDLHAMLAALGGAQTHTSPGTRLDAWQSQTWADLAYGTIADRWEVALSAEGALVLDRQSGGARLMTRARPGAPWVERPSGAPPSSLEDILLERRLKARLCAGKMWTRAHYSPATSAERLGASGGLCGR